MSRNDKETIVFVANVGGFGDVERNKKFVDNAKQLIKSVVEKKIFLEPKDEIGIILMGVEIGVNSLQFDNIEDYHPIQVANWKMVEKVLDITLTNIFFGNWISGLRAGIHLMQTEAVNAKRKTIVMITDCPDTEICHQEMKNVAASILAEEIALLWVGTSSMLDLGREQRNDSEKMVQRLCRRVDGKHVTFSELLPKLHFYGGKQPKPIGWQCNLEICDIRIPILVYLYITENSPLPSWKSVAKDPETESPRNYKKVIKTKAMADYHKKEYEIDDIVRGYKYGGAFVPMSDEFMTNLKNVNANKSLILYGLVSKDKVNFRDRCGEETHIILPSQDAETHFFSLLKAMIEMKLVGIIRRVYFDKCQPKMFILYPQADVKDKSWCFFMVEFMYKEDFCVIEPRKYEDIFNRLKNDEWNVVENLIDQMMLKDQMIEDVDNMKFELGTISNPDIQHVWNRLADRALHLLTDEDPSTYPPIDYLKKLISLPKFLQTKRLDSSIDQVVQIFKLNEQSIIEESTNVAVDFSITEKSNESGYSTQSCAQNNLSTQMDINLDEIVSNHVSE